MGSPFLVFFSRGKGFHYIVSRVVFDVKGYLFMSVTGSSSSSSAGLIGSVPALYSSL